MTTIAEFLADVRDRSPYMLAEMAGCSAPDGTTSLGALCLVSILDGFVEAVEYGRLAVGMRGYPEDRDIVMRDVTDSVVSDYTHEMWSEFIDLAAWQRSPDMLSDFGNEIESIDDHARDCLQSIMKQLFKTLVAEFDDCDDTPVEEWVCDRCGNPEADFDLQASGPDGEFVHSGQCPDSE